METIRINTFETNSSSTHSITILERIKPQENNIPRNLTKKYGKNFIVSEYGDCCGGDDKYTCDILSTEIDKLGFIINMIASICENEYFDMWDYDKKDDENYKKEIFMKLINTRLFKWVQEVVFEETGTMIEYEMPENDYFPFYETTYDEINGVEELLNANDEKKFKENIKNIIFNKDMIIENEICPYGMER